MKANKMLACFMLFLTGCAMPSTSVKTIDTRPSISVKGASKLANLYVDGIDFGKATEFDGDPQVLIVEPGTHRVSVVEGNNVIFDQTIFVESEHKSITVK